MTDHYVIDPSALIKGFVRETWSENVLELLSRVPDRVELHAPEFCLVECTNILWKYVGRQEMSVESAAQAVMNLTDLTLNLHPASPYLAEALKVGLDRRLAVYDSLYLTLAEQLRMPLITADGPQERSARDLRIEIVPLTEIVPTS
ncbi:MAG: type II toxin-antitoxin system VapC family toxin [Anaerolineae bacterium]|nr:type II toxin-antitoxin system VapC family toxin [Anaerolineae bacterium]